MRDLRSGNRLRLAVLAALYSGSAVAGDVTFDGTVGAAGAAAFNTTTHTFTVGEDRGTLTGANLFHSFTTFIVDGGETAAFTSTTPGITNVISRVTGIGSPSGLQPTTINGTLRSEIPGASFWFINPAGITVGPDGVIDIPGALALGAADYVEFGTQRWYALGNQGDAASALTVDPLDFGFVDNSTAGRLTWNRTGDFTLAPLGDLILANADLRTDGNLRLEGDSVVLSGSNIRTEAISANAGDITVFARESGISLQRSLLSATGIDQFDAGDVVMDAPGSVRMVDSDVRASRVGTGGGTNPSGNITVNGRTFTMLGGTLDVSLTADADARAGTIVLGTGVGRVSLDTVTIGLSPDQTLSGPRSFARLIALKGGGNGSAGEIRIVASGLVEIIGAGSNFSVDEVFQSNIFAARADAIPSLDVRNLMGKSAFSAGSGGLIQIHAGDLRVQDALLIAEQGPQRAHTEVESTGIDIDIANRLTADRAAFLALGPLTNSQPIMMRARELQLSNGSVVSTAVGDDGRTADINISAFERLYTNRDLDSGTALSSVDAVLINGEVSSGRTDQGDIFLRAADAGADIRLNETRIESSLGNTSPFGIRPTSVFIEAGAGFAELDATDVRLQAGAPDGNAGSIFISGDRVALNDGTNLSSVAGGRGFPGQVSVTAVTSITANSSAASGARVTISTAELEEAGLGGAQIVIEAPTVSLRNVDIVSSSVSEGRGAGDRGPAVIQITGPLTLTLDRVQIDTRTFAERQGGNITLNGGQINLIDTDITSSSSTCPAPEGCGSAGFEDGPAGDVRIQGSRIAMNGGSVQSTTDTEADAGTIRFEAGEITLHGGEVTSSTAGVGNAGDIHLTAISPSGSGSQDASLRIDSGARLASTAEGSAQTIGRAGRIELNSAGAIRLENSEVTSSAGVNAGQAGLISMSSERDLTLQGATVRTTVDSTKVGLSAAEVTLASTNGIVTLSGNTTVDATTSGAAPAGNVLISGGAVLIEDSSVSSRTTGSADAGAISVVAASTASAALGSANAVANRAVIPSAGGIAVESSTLTTSTSGAGSAGDISLLAPGELLLQHATLQSASTSPLADAGLGGSITLSSGASGNVVVEDSLIQTDTAAADAGTITIDANGAPLTLRDARIVASAGGAGNGANVIIDGAAQTIMQRAAILAQAVAGNGGNITINLQPGAVLVRDSQSVINASSDAGNDGEIEINAPDTDLNSAIKPQDIEDSTPPELSASACTRPEGGRSTFVREGKGGVAESLDSYLTIAAAEGQQQVAATGVRPRTLTTQRCL